MKIATHNGTFHADDIFGVTVLEYIAPPLCEIIRTRDPKVIASADYAVDVGGVWDPTKGQFDHHQKGFAGKRESGSGYASAGIVWAHHGAAFVSKLMPSVSSQMAQYVATEIDKELIQYVDMEDTGEMNCAPGIFGLSAILSNFNMNWMDEERLIKSRQQNGSDLALARAEFQLARFHDAIEFVFDILSRAISNKVCEASAAERVRSSDRIEDGKVLMLTNGGLPWTKVVHEEMPDLLFVIYPDSTDSQYQIRTVPVEPDSFVARKDLPASWAGLRDADLAAATGVEDAVFCHNGLFIAGARSLAGAIKLSQLALVEMKGMFNGAA